MAIIKTYGTVLNRSLQLILFLFFLSTIYHLQSTISYAASFKMSPATATFKQSCDSSVDISIEAQGGSSNAADIIVEYDPILIEVTDLIPGNVYQNYFGKVINNGLLRLTGASLSSNFTTWGTFATIKFRPRVNNSTAYFNIRFTGANQYNTLDSNIADSVTSNDLLTSVGHGFYSFTSGSCLTDTTPPIITFTTPQNGQTGIPSTANIILQISDTPSGVNINSVEIVINGVSYPAFSPQVSYTGNPSQYSFTITPTDPLYPNNINTLLVKAADLSGNSTQKSITFNQPSTVITPIPQPTCPIAPECPICQSTTPTPLPTPTVDTSSPTIEFINPNSPFQIKITDPNINPDTIKVSLDDQIYTLASPELTYQNGLITLNLTTPLTPGRHRLTVFVADTNQNGISQSANFQTYGRIAMRPSYLLFLLPLPLILFFLLRRHHQTGFVFDSTTLLPVNLATIKIYRQNNKHLLTTTSNSLGIFTLHLPKNHYHLSITHPNYQNQLMSFTIDKKKNFIAVPLKPTV